MTTPGKPGPAPRAAHSRSGFSSAYAAHLARVRGVERTLAQFRDPRTGEVTLVNTFRWVAARRPS